MRWLAYAAAGFVLGAIALIWPNERYDPSPLTLAAGVAAGAVQAVLDGRRPREERRAPLRLALRALLAFAIAGGAGLVGFLVTFVSVAAG